MRGIIVSTVVALAIGSGYAATVQPTGPRSLRVFDPDRLADLELDMWQAYYRHEQSRLFLDLVTTLREQYHCSYESAARVGFHFARAASTFSGRTTTPDQVLPDLEQGYEVVSGCVDAKFDPVAVARAELAWWVARRTPGRSSPEQVGALIAEENALLFGVPAERVLSASILRARAGRLRDEGGADADWTRVGQLLRQSYRELYAAVSDDRPSATPK